MFWPCRIKSLFPQCFWRSSKPLRWSPVKREILEHPPWSKLAWRGFVPMRKQGSISRTHTARWAFVPFSCLRSYITTSCLISKLTSLHVLLSDYMELFFQDIFWSVYIGKLCFKNMTNPRTHYLSLTYLISFQMETSVLKTLARMEPCVQTALEATTASASRVSQGSTVKMVQNCCRQHVKITVS